MKILRPLSVLAAFVVACSMAHAATTVAAPAIPRKAPGSVAILLGADSVRKELHLTSLQTAVLSDIRSEYRDDARSVVAKQIAGKLTKPQAQAEIDSLTASSERRALRSLNDDQRQRLNEIQFQILGGYELLSPSLQAKLGLTDQQKAKIAKIWIRGDKYTSKVNARFERGEISRYQRLVDLRDNRLDRSDDFLSVLTKDQLAKFQQLCGAKFDAGLS